ncbi:hypothetical protein HPB52_010452 [Rhipicephalus sanguineus]|uniref:DDE Tnp4 domain-containing protein n=1 Tax=Rhipicephalus sanguineus TaxID=34632 RepID=A0A9D4SW55_RHISA|nr:hypothetical protein HPB52_010452 [Rhipicephalus sanguineus]
MDAACCKKLIVLLESSSSSDSEDDTIIATIQEHRRERPKVDNFVADVVASFDDEEKTLQTESQYLRIADEAVRCFTPIPQEPLTWRDATEECRRTHLAFLWYAGNKATFRSVAQLFGMSESTLHEVVDRVADFLEAVAPKYLKMPLTEEEKQQTSVCFEAIAGFPNVLGAMDGTHIRTRCPNKKVKASFVDRHDTPTYTLQGICNADRLFLDVFCGPPGRCHDSNVYDLSFVSAKLPVICEAGRFHIIADAAYPLREYIMTPYRDHGHMTAEEKRFNYRLSRTRVRIENAFGVLKSRFRQLLYLEFHTPERSTKFMLACCVLHNICIMNGEQDLDDESGTDDSSDEETTQDSTVTTRLLRRLGQEKRRALARSFN